MTWSPAVLDLGDSKTFWLNLTNIALGIATIALLLGVALTAIREAIQRAVSGRQAFRQHHHAGK
jgi:hypothetical protein